MVSGKSMPCLEWLLKRWSESRAAVPTGRCPIGHRGEFLYVLKEHIWGLWSNFPWYSMGVFLFSISHQFAMLFNGNFTFFSFFINFPCYSMGSLHFIHFPCYSMGIWSLRSFGEGGTYRHTYVTVHPCLVLARYQKSLLYINHQKIDVTVDVQIFPV